MKFLLSALFSVISFGAIAQVSIGFRSGLFHEFALEQKWDGISADPYWYNERPVTDFNSEVFAGYNCKKWIFSLGLMRSKEALNYNYSYEGYGHWGGYMVVDARTSGTRTTTYFNTSAAYDCSPWKNKKLRTYFGLGISPIYVANKTETYELLNNVSSYEKNSGHEWKLRFGVMNTTTYQLNKNVAIVSDVALRTSGFYESFIPFYETNSLLSAQLGVSYKITP